MVNFCQAKEGATVIINGRAKERVQQAITQIKEKNPNALLIPAPVGLSNHQEINTLIQQQPAVDILINNVGIYEAKPFLDTSWLYMFDVNVMSDIGLSHHYLAPMLQKNRE